MKEILVKSLKTGPGQTGILQNLQSSNHWLLYLPDFLSVMKNYYLCKVTLNKGFIQPVTYCLVGSTIPLE